MMEKNKNFHLFLKYILENIDTTGFFQKYPDIPKQSIITSIQRLLKSDTIKNKFKIYCDGASRGNPGEAGAGFVIFDENNNVIYEGKKYLGIKTNNEAEYSALILAIESLLKHYDDVNEIKIFSDSELMVKQLNGEYKVKNQRLIPLYERVKNLLKNFNYIIKHINRDKNRLADKLANKAIDEK